VQRKTLNRTVLAASAGAGAVVALMAAGGAGYLVGNSHAAGRTITRTVTVTKTAPPKVVTRWKTNTKTVTVTATATPQAATVPCGAMAMPAGSSGQVEIGHLGGPADTTCTVSVISPEGASHLGVISLTAPDGQSSNYALNLQP
jgi:carbohydrate-binding DOMON domain-containing protein